MVNSQIWPCEIYMCNSMQVSALHIHVFLQTNCIKDTFNQSLWLVCFSFQAAHHLTVHHQILSWINLSSRLVEHKYQAPSLVCNGVNSPVATRFLPLPLEYIPKVFGQWGRYSEASKLHAVTWRYHTSQIDTRAGTCAHLWLFSITCKTAIEFRYSK